MLILKDLLIEYMKNPLGLDEEKPRFSWKLQSDGSDIFQKSYRIVVEDMWDSGRVESLKRDFWGKSSGEQNGLGM